jgi:UDP-GlcNAc:undecaprenyl-phosphate/decaprenyl-phosphate GlcNAc-1-phosphate transferase
VHALSLLLASVFAALLAPFVLRTLRAGGHVRENFRGRALPFPLGVLVLAAALLALVPLVLVERIASAEVFEPQLVLVLVYVLGVACLGLIDDAYGAAGLDGVGGDRVREHGVEGPVGAGGSERPGGPERAGVTGEAGGHVYPRGWRGHARAVLRGELSTGALKAGGSLGLALVLMSFAERSTGRWLLASAVLVLATNLFNLLDLRPGRAIKAFVLLGAGLTAGSAELLPLWALGLFAGPALVAGVYDVRERAMLGDTGANLLGALAGLWMVLVLSTTGLEIALALLLLCTVYGEFRSISALVEKTPGVRWLDSLGRPS